MRNHIMEPWSAKNVVEYYSTHRDNIDDLYTSEKYFLEEVLKRVGSVLDVGCAAGGFSEIAKSYNPDIKYTGVDISSNMISEAKKRFPANDFFMCDGRVLDFPDNSFGAILCFGVLHMTENWKELLREQWRVCRNTFLFDVRLVEGNGICDVGRSYQRLEFDGNWDGISKAPYIILNFNDFMSFIENLVPGAGNIRTYGYWHQVSKSTVSTYDNVCMSVFCLEKEGPCGFDIKNWKLPIKLSLTQ